MRLRDDARLARAGAGEDQQRPVDVEDRFALFGVEGSRSPWDRGSPIAEPIRRSYSTVTLFARLRG